MLFKEIYQTIGRNEFYQDYYYLVLNLLNFYKGIG